MNVTLVGPNVFINNKCYMTTGEYLLLILTVPLAIAVSFQRKARLPRPASKKPVPIRWVQAMDGHIIGFKL